MSLINDIPSKIILFGEHTILHGGHAIAMAINMCGSVIVENDEYPGFYVNDINGSSFVLKIPNMKNKVKITLKTRLGCGLGSSAIISLVIAKYFMLSLESKDLILKSENSRKNINPFKNDGNCTLQNLNIDLDAIYNQLKNMVKNNQIENSNFKLILNQNGNCDILLNLACQIEHLFHGKSSGIDVIATWNGGLIKFCNCVYEELNSEYILKYKIIIWDSGIGKDTKKVTNQVKITQEIIENINLVVLKGIELIQRPFELKEIYLLIRENQNWLEKLGIVPNCMNEEIKKMRILGIESKISGAGHGGHLITFVEKDKFYEGWTDVSLYVK